MFVSELGCGTIEHRAWLKEVSDQSEAEFLMSCLYITVSPDIDKD